MYFEMLCTSSGGKRVKIDLIRDITPVDGYHNTYHDLLRTVHTVNGIIVYQQILV